jgi:hypothetical protein
MESREGFKSQEEKEKKEEKKQKKRAKKARPDLIVLRETPARPKTHVPPHNTTICLFQIPLLPFF